MLHGHRYAIEITFQSAKLDHLGRVIDFGTVRDILGKWIDDNFDHNVILNIADKKLGDEISKITGQQIYYMNENPTAENIASHLLHEICPKLFLGFNDKSMRIRLYETPNCFAESYEQNYK